MLMMKKDERSFGKIKVSINAGNKTVSPKDSRRKITLPIIILNSIREILKFSELMETIVLSAYDLSENDYNTPFCILLFKSENEYKRFSRAIFHNINAKQVPLTLEHNRKVIIEGTETFPDDTLFSDPSFGPQYYLTRKPFKVLTLHTSPMLILISVELLQHFSLICMVFCWVTIQ